MKKILPLIILIVIFAGLLIGYSALKKKSPDTPVDTTTADDTYIMIAEKLADDIESISYTAEGERLSFIRADGKWKNSDDEKMPINQTIIDQMVSTAANIGASRKIPNGVDNAAEYGLDEPVLTVGVVYYSGDKVTYTVGDTNAFSQDVYFALSGDDAVYTVNAAFCGFFDYTAKDLLMLDKMASISKDEIKSVLISTSLGDRQLVSETSDDTDEIIWKITAESGEQTALASETADDLLSNLISLDLDECADYDASEDELAEYGLDNPIVITINYAREKSVSAGEQGSSTGTVIIDYTYKIDIGLNSEEKAFAKLENSYMVFEVDLSGISLLLWDTVNS